VFDVRPDVPCMAIVDRLDMQIGGGSWQWRVTVRTAPFWTRQMTRTYFIEANCDTLAAQEGIRRFVAAARVISTPISPTVH
jgi:hypothetical protein